MSNESLFPLVPIKYITDVLSGGTPRSNAQYWDGDLPFITPPDLNGLDGSLAEHWGRTVTEVGAKAGSTVAQSAVLISCRAPVGHVGTIMDRAAFNQGCKAVVPSDESDLSFIAKCLVADRKALQAASRGTTFTELSTTELLNHAIPWPEPSVRHRIADYLDRETGQIDAMIDKLGELEVTLNDRRVDAIKRAITSETSIAIGIMVDVTLGKMLQPSQKRLDDVQRPYLRAAHVQPGGVIDFEVDEKQMWFSDTEVQTLDLRAGDTVVVEGGAGFGRAAHLTEDLPGWGFQNSIIRLRGSESDGRYLMYSLHSALDSGAIHVACNAATFAHFTAEKVESFRVPFHEPAERARIADHLDDVTSKIDAMLSKVAELKDLLTERRAALITDVVTGRKEVA